MFRLIGLVVSIGLADSLNPTTIAPALYLASGPHPKRAVASFTLGVFIVYFAGGAAVALGPGEILLDIVPHPHHDARHIIEIVAGVMVLAAGAWVWRRREKLSARAVEKAEGGKLAESNSILLGATITAVELPTAFPYFAAITAIVGDDLRPVHTLFLLLVFNLCFIAPLLGILATLWLAGDHAVDILTRWRLWLHRHWPVLVGVAAFIAGSISVLIGASGIIVGYHGRIPNLFRRARHFFHLTTHP